MKITQFFIIGILTLPALARAGDLMDTGIDKCVNAYYGIGEKTDYAKAYKCFDAKKIWPYMIIMQLNGQGVPVNPDKAKQLMDQWDKADPYNIKTLDHTQLREIVIKRTQDKTPSAKNVDFCNDVAGTTYSMDFCGDVTNRLQKQEDDLDLASIRGNLSPNQAKLWDNMQGAAEAYFQAEGQRLEQRYANGTIRGAAFQGQVSYVRQNFLNLMKSVFGEKQLKVFSGNDLEKTDMDMQVAYKDDIKKYFDQEKWLDSADSSDDDKEQFKEEIAAYNEDAKDAQDKWRVLEQLSAKLAASVYPKSNVDWAISMQVTMTKLRILDIKDDPVRED